MPIGIIFTFAGSVLEVIVKGGEVIFMSGVQRKMGTIDNVKLDKAGVIKEFPDLKDDEDWQKKARERFKEKMLNMKTEKERAEYILDDLKKFGYKPVYWQQSGYRPIKL